MRHKFYIPIGFPNLAAAPSTPQMGDSYFDTLLKQVRTWDGTKWTVGGGTLTAGAGLTSIGTSMAEDITLDVKTGTGIRIVNDAVALDTGSLGGRVPTGTIVAFGGSVAPAEWHLCDGTPHGSAALQAVIGALNTPDLRDKFIAGAGRAYALKATGGVDQVTLTAQQSGLPSHTHTAWSTGEGDEHTHVVDPPNTGTTAAGSWHNHGISSMGGGGHGHNHYASNLLSGQGDFNPAGDGHQFLIGTGALINADGTNHSHSGATDVSDVAHSHTVEINPFQSGGRSAVHTHPVGVGAVAAADSGAPHENRPPFYALTYIIKL